MGLAMMCGVSFATALGKAKVWLLTGGGLPGAAARGFAIVVKNKALSGVEKEKYLVDGHYQDYPQPSRQRGGQHTSFYWLGVAADRLKASGVGRVNPVELEEASVTALDAAFEESQTLVQPSPRVIDAQQAQALQAFCQALETALSQPEQPGGSTRRPGGNPRRRGGAGERRAAARRRQQPRAWRADWVAARRLRPEPGDRPASGRARVEWLDRRDLPPLPQPEPALGASIAAPAERCCPLPRRRPRRSPSQAWACTQCGAAMDSVARFCAQRGAPVVAPPARRGACARCGAQLRRGQTFCGSCGTAVPRQAGRDDDLPGLPDARNRAARPATWSRRLARLHHAPAASRRPGADVPGCAPGRRGDQAGAGRRRRALQRRPGTAGPDRDRRGARFRRRARALAGSCGSATARARWGCRSARACRAIPGRAPRTWAAGARQPGRARPGDAGAAEPPGLAGFSAGRCRSEHLSGLGGGAPGDLGLPGVPAPEPVRQPLLRGLRWAAGGGAPATWRAATWRAATWRAAIGAHDVFELRRDAARWRTLLRQLWRAASVSRTEHAGGGKPLPYERGAAGLPSFPSPPQGRE